MELELFKKQYTPTMMRIVKDYSEILEHKIKKLITNESHYNVLEAKEKIDNLATAKMLLKEYEACPYCFEPDCTSDHK
jgi:hypothetical protein